VVRVMSGVGLLTSCRCLFKKLNVLPIACQYILHVSIYCMSVYIACQYILRVSIYCVSVYIACQYILHVSIYCMSVYIASQYILHVSIYIVLNVAHSG
jgi:hypothetical protein